MRCGALVGGVSAHGGAVGPCELLYLTEVFTLVGGEVKQYVHALAVGAW